jgi:RNA polymerase subunit RPABC4/transcription elongation factor Spt4
MGRRQTMMEKYKQQMKAYRKKRMQKDNTPFLPPDGDVYVMDSLNPTKKIKAEVVKTCTKQHREIIENLACPVCGNQLEWDSNWEGFICEKHGKKAIYELVDEE